MSKTIENFLAQYPDDTSPIAFKAVPNEEGLLPFVNPAHAQAIETILEQTGCDDPQARLLARLYRDGSVTRRNAGALEDAMQALDPAEILARVVTHGEDNGSIDPDAGQAVFDAIGGIIFAHVHVVDKNGLSAAETNQDGQVIPAVEDNFVSMFGAGSLEQNFADSLELSHFGYQNELVWTEDEVGLLHPSFLSNRQHAALGYVGLNGQFVHLYTVLSEDHPVRQT